MPENRLPDRLFAPSEAKSLAHLLNAAQVFHGNWKAKDLCLNSPRRLYLSFERDPRAGTLRHFIESVIDD